jgi:hypothetical protein
VSVPSKTGGKVTIKVDGTTVSTDGQLDTTYLTNGEHQVTVVDDTGKVTTQTIKVENKLPWWKQLRNRIFAPLHGNVVAILIASAVLGLGVIGGGVALTVHLIRRRPILQ